jgi:hypothetical protein
MVSVVVASAWQLKTVAFSIFESSPQYFFLRKAVTSSSILHPLSLVKMDFGDNDVCT